MIILVTIVTIFQTHTGREIIRKKRNLLTSDLQKVL